MLNRLVAHPTHGRDNDANDGGDVLLQRSADMRRGMAEKEAVKRTDDSTLWARVSAPLAKQAGSFVEETPDVAGRLRTRRRTHLPPNTGRGVKDLGHSGCEIRLQAHDQTARRQKMKSWRSL